MKHKHKWKELRRSCWDWCKSCGTLRTYYYEFDRITQFAKIKYRYYKPKHPLRKGEKKGAGR